MSPITTHVLDIAAGRPAQGLSVSIEVAKDSEHWLLLAQGVTDASGRIAEFNPPLQPLTAGTYRLRFDTGAYFAAAGVRGFYPEVVVIVQIDDPAQHDHIPLLLSPYGYTTYRGSR